MRRLLGVAIRADIDNENVFAEFAGQGSQIVFELAAPDGHYLFATPDWSPGAVYLELDLERFQVKPLHYERG